MNYPPILSTDCRLDRASPRLTLHEIRFMTTREQVDWPDSTKSHGQESRPTRDGPSMDWR